MAKTSARESARLSALYALEILDSDPEAEFDAIVRAAAAVCDVPISLISLVDDRRQWFKANFGLEGVRETPRNIAFCGSTIEQPDLLEVPNALDDARFADNPLVGGAPHIRFYAGSPLCLSDGSRVGSLCVIDEKPRTLTAEQRTALKHLASAASRALESRRAARKQHDELRRTTQLLYQTGELARVGGWELDLLRSELVWSEETCRIHGVPDNYEPNLEVAIGFYEPESLNAIRESVALAIKDGTGWDSELRLRRADGRSIWVRVVGKVDMENGEAIRLRGAILDIDDSVRQRHELESLNERMTLATNSGEIGIWEYDLQTSALDWTPQMFALYGRAEGTGQLNFSDWENSVHPDDLQQAQAALDLAIAGHGDLDLDFRIIWPDGSVHHLLANAHIKRNAEGVATHMLGVNWDITPLREVSNELAAQHELLQVTMQSIDDAVITTDTEGCITWLNPSAESLTGWSCESASAKPLEQVYNLIHDRTRVAQDNPVMECLRTGSRVGPAHHSVLVDRNNTEYGIEDSAAPIRDAKGELLGVVLVFRDVTEQRRLSSMMTYRATHDDLTAIYNRSEFEARLQQTLAALHVAPGTHALMFVDLDQFKLVNDACGHSVGDQLLQQIAVLLGQSLRDGDVLARLGGDEFGVILNNCNAQQAQAIAGNICQSMDDFRFTHAERRFRIGASIGLVPLDNRWESMAAIMQAADTSCYAAKEAGRNRVHVWFDTDEAMNARRGDMKWAARLEHALDENQFELFAQRIQGLTQDQTPLHAEVLIRLRDDNDALILPSAFLPAAERFNLITRIDRWVLRRTIDTLSQQVDLDRIAKLWVNLSGLSVSDGVFHADAVELLEHAGRDICQRICLEITETAAVTNYAGAVTFIGQLKALGVCTALDDFGAGASSFSYLKKLPVDFIKIDGQYITHLSEDPLDQAAVRCFLDVGNIVGVKTVAEHVESEEVLTRIIAMGTHYAQGFHLHKPEPIAQVLADSQPLRAAAEF